MTSSRILVLLELRILPHIYSTIQLLLHDSVVSFVLVTWLMWFSLTSAGAKVVMMELFHFMLVQFPAWYIHSFIICIRSLYLLGRLLSLQSARSSSGNVVAPVVCFTCQHGTACSSSSIKWRGCGSLIKHASSRRSLFVGISPFLLVSELHHHHHRYHSTWSARIYSSPFSGGGTASSSGIIPPGRVYLAVRSSVP